MGVFLRAWDEAGIEGEEEERGKGKGKKKKLIMIRLNSRFNGNLKGKKFKSVTIVISSIVWGYYWKTRGYHW